VRKTDAISIRLEPDVRARLEAVSKKLGLDKATLIRLAIKGLLDEADSNGGQLLLPYSPSSSVRSPALVAEKVSYRTTKKKKASAG
jgi:hypothetical protein